jgi:hypothetical protein
MPATKIVVLCNRRIAGIDTCSLSRKSLAAKLKGPLICWVMCRYVTHNQVEVVQSSGCMVRYFRSIAALRVAMEEECDD